jgi:hypothetical protein
LKRFLVMLAVLISSILGFAKDQPVKVSTITNASDPASAEVMKQVRQKLGAHPKLFEIVTTDNPSMGLIVMADCMSREDANDPYVCFYTTHYAGGPSKTFMGGGVYVAKTANEMADNVVSAVAQDVAERWNDIMRTNSIERLESCLFLTQSSCMVPATLVPEVKAKILNLSQYLQKGGLKK